MQRQPWRIVLSSLLVFLYLLAPLAAGGGQEIGTVTRVRGTAQIFRTGVAEPLMVAQSLAVQLEDRLRTAAGASVRIELADESVLSVGEQASLKLAEFDFSSAEGKRQVTLEMLLGKVMVLAKDVEKLKANSFQVKTPTAVVGVRGTLFVVWVVSDTITRVTCYENEVTVYNVFKPESIIVLPAKGSTEVIRQEPPGQPILLNEQQMEELRRNLDQTPGVDRGPVGAAERFDSSGPFRRAGEGITDGTGGTYLQTPGVFNPGAIGAATPTVTSVPPPPPPPIPGPGGLPAPPTPPVDTN